MNNTNHTYDLNRKELRTLLLIGLAGAVLTGAGDFLLGYAEETPGMNFAAQVMSGAANLTDAQMIAGSLLGMFGILMEGIGCVAVFRLMKQNAPKEASLYFAGMVGYIWLAPIGCHLNMGILNMAYKYLLSADTVIAAAAAEPLFYGFSLPVYILLVLCWVPMMIIQFRIFAQGKTPYPVTAKWFAILPGTLPAFLLSALLGPHTALGAAVGTMFLSFGNAFMFGGLLALLPDQDRLDEYVRTQEAAAHSNC